MAGSRSDFAWRPAREGLRRRRNPPRGWKIRIDCLFGPEVCGVVRRGGVDSLARCTEPGAERARMGAGLMVPMLELVGDNLRKRKSCLDKNDPRQRDDQVICEARVHKRKSASH